jgi:hypothetical protein
MYVNPITQFTLCGLIKAMTFPISFGSSAKLNYHKLEKRVREHAGDKEHAWETAGQEAGLQIWRIEKFHVIPWPKDKYGSFYDGDSYIILNVSTVMDLIDSGLASSSDAISIADHLEHTHRRTN